MYAYFERNFKCIIQIVNVFLTARINVIFKNGTPSAVEEEAGDVRWYGTHDVHNTSYEFQKCWQCQQNFLIFDRDHKSHPYEFFEYLNNI